MIERGDGLPAPETAKRIEAATNGEVTAAELLGLLPTKQTDKSLAASEEPTSFIHAKGDLDTSLSEEAISYGLDPAKIARGAIERAVKTERMKRFSEENREAIESWNELIEREGLWSDGLRAF